MSIGKSLLFDHDEIWCVARGRSVMYDDMTFDWMDGQDQDHGPGSFGIYDFRNLGIPVHEQI